MTESFATQVCEARKVHRLPREPCASAILASYAASKDRLPAQLSPDSRPDFAEGMLDYLDELAGQVLIYDRERRQLEEQMQEGRRPREVYGLEMLVRLLARLPALCAWESMTREVREETQACWLDLRRFLDRLAPSLLPAVMDM